eukprot:m.77973 g.77973  ORF g.77973 m.77973 type:complete len:160 (+) comp14567_c0_seq2:1318-1797(+)
MASSSSTGKHPVKVFMYDLSHGMMAQMSPHMLGRQLSGVWHTAVVVYGKEFYFGGGIQSASPGTTPAGQPLKTIDYGHTEVPEWLLQEHLSGLHAKFNASTYHLLERNCNHFAEEVLQLLCGKSLPDEVRNLPADFASTPLGQMLTPMIDGLFKNMAPV